MPPSLGRIECPKCHWQHLPKVGALHDGVYQGKCQHCAATFTFKSTSIPRSEVKLSINGVSYSVAEEDASMRLVEFIHEKTGLLGTKTMCYEGGCGLCVVSATYTDHVMGRAKTISLNSCLRPVYACSGMDIWTSEGIGNRKAGFHPIQSRLADYNGSQCGYCSPGMVMNMYSLLKDKPDVTEQEVEDAFGGNICRCTGYRPILAAMRSFAKDGTNAVTDIEDLKPRGCCKQKGGEKACSGSCQREGDNDAMVVMDPVHVTLQDADWNIPTSLSQLYSILKSAAGKNVRLVHGNTGMGVYKQDGPYDVYVDVTQVKELCTKHISTSSVKIGSNVTLTNLIEILDQASSTPGFAYLTTISKHISKIAQVPVRNVGSWAGNLMLKYAHHEFASDLFPALEAIDARITVGSVDGSEDTISASQLIDADMEQRLILSMTLYPMSKHEYVQMYKIMPRAQNSHAYVNAGIWMKLDRTKNFTVMEKPRLVFGGISSDFNHATKTEAYLVGKQLTNALHLEGAFKVLQSEITPDPNPVYSSPAYRKNLPVALLYKYVLHVCGEKVATHLKSGGDELTRPLSSGKQTYSSDAKKYPVTQALPKISAKIQASGEAEYIETMPALPGELYAQFVLSTVGNAKIASMDPSDALAMPGVVKFLTARDIPAGGLNSFMTPPQAVEEVLSSGEILYAGQAIGLIIAESAGVAIGAARKVKVTYTDVKPPILTLEDAIKQQSFFPKPGDDVVVGNAGDAIKKSAVVIEGEVPLGPQYHFHMETQTCRCVPTDDGMEVYASTQWPDSVQNVISQFLAVKSHSIHVQTKRIGGAYGAKISRNGQISAACALASHVTDRPVHMHLTLKDNMELVGKRIPYIAKYQVGVTKDGLLNGIHIQYYADDGSNPNDSVVSSLNVWADNAYKCANWHLIPVSVKTNTPSNTWCRAPGSIEAVFIMETIMEHVAEQLGQDPTTIKQLNLYKKDDVTINGESLPYCSIRDLVPQLEKSADVANRRKEIDQFNKENRWKKKGLGVVPLKYALIWNANKFNVLVNIYNGDGTVSVSHGGIEIGQGIHTKVAQVCAYELGIPLSMVIVNTSETIATANSTTTGGSSTSELCCKGVIECCAELNKRIAPVKARMPGALWKDIIAECYAASIDLSQRYWVAPHNDKLSQYNTYGVTCSEVELDVLTGESIVRRVDILYDCGESINPEVDVGQVEGGFVMGIGYYMTEVIRYDPKTGQNLSSTTWEYKPPGAKDIPVDFRVELLKNAPNPLGVLGSKAVGEPPMVMSCSVIFAIKHAIEAARKDAGVTEHFNLGPPATVEVTQMNCSTDFTQFVLQ